MSTSQNSQIAAPSGKSPLLLALGVLVLVGVVLGTIYVGQILTRDTKPEEGTFSLTQQVRAAEPPPEKVKETGKEPPGSRNDMAAPPSKWPTTPAVDPVPKPDDGVIVDDTHAIAWFEHLDKQRPIYASKSFKIANPLIDPVSNKARLASATQFGGFQFWVKPDLILDQGQLEAAYAAKKPTGKQDGKDQFEMAFEGRIIDEFVKKKAAATLNELFPNAGVTAERIKVIPPRGLSLYVWVGDRPVELSGPLPPSGQVSEVVRVKVKGTDEALKNIRDDARLEIRYTVSGYRVKQNISVGMVQLFARAAFHKVMIGDASYEALSRHRQELTSGGLDLGVVRFGGQERGIDNTYKRDTKVTRNVVKFAATQCNEVIRTHNWLEMPADRSAFDAKCEDLTKNLLARAKELRVEVNVPNLAKPEELVAKDVRPDVLGELSATVKAKNHVKRDKEVKGEYEGVKASVDKKYLDEDDVTWEEKTGPTGTKITVPKTIRVYDFSEVDFNQVTLQTVVESQPEWVTMPVAHEPAVSYRDVPMKTEKANAEGVAMRMNGKGMTLTHGDEDLDADDDGYPIQFEFRADAAVVTEQGGVRKIKVSTHYKLYEVEPDNTTAERADTASFDLPDKFVHLGHDPQPAERLLYTLQFHHYGGHKGYVNYDPRGPETQGAARARGRGAVPRLEHINGTPSGTPLHSQLKFFAYGNREDVRVEGEYDMLLKIPFTRLVEPARYEYRTRVTTAEQWKPRPH